MAKKKPGSRAHDHYDSVDRASVRSRVKPSEQDYMVDEWDAPIDEDSMDREMSEPRPMPRKKKGGKKKGKNAKHGKKKRRDSRGILGSVYLTIALIICIVMLIITGVNRVKISKRFNEVKSVVCVDHFYEGSIVEDINVSGMTLDSAIDYWNRNVETNYANATVKLDNGMRVTAAELGYTTDYADVLRAAYYGVRKGSIEERYDAILQHSTTMADHAVHRSFYNDSMVRTYVDQLTETVDVEPQDACLLSFNTETYEFEYQDEIVGARLDREQLVSDIEAALQNGGGTVTLKIDPILPAITKDNIAANYGMISYAVTDASSSSSNRLSNIKLALSYINGTEVAPGDTFSFNKVVGERTTDRGFKKAPAYSSGQVKDEIGGGICQVSTTVFNAAVKADMRIKERHAHSMTVSYVDPGKDAAVDWGNKDLRFENTSSDKVYICCYLTKDARVRVGVFGKLLPDGDSIELEVKRTEKIDFNTEYQISFELGSGEMKLYQEGKKGARATTYKVLLDADGNEITREELFKSKYNPQARIVLYGQ